MEQSSDWTGLGDPGLSGVTSFPCSLQLLSAIPLAPLFNFKPSDSFSVGGMSP